MITYNDRGIVTIRNFELDSIEFTDMSFFESKIPEGTKVVKVKINYDPGFYNHDKDITEMEIHWISK
jgi:hypothetical protein